MAEKHPKVFVLGDSRTGTKSISNYLRRHGLSCLHYYVEAAQQVEPLHTDHAGNWERLRRFLETDSSDAYADYPTRTFYKELHREFPSSFFILTTRDSTSRWAQSMMGYFEKFNITIDINSLSANYEALNHEIFELFSRDRNFLSICIDDDNDQIADRLADFLTLPKGVPLNVENASELIDNSTLSTRGSIFGFPAKDVLDQVSASCAPSKAMPSEHGGWLFLINDSNRYLEYLFGKIAWTSDDANRAIGVIDDRIFQLAKTNITYLKYIVPEKASVYPEFLPRVLESLTIPAGRPAQLISNHPNVSYLHEYLIDLKSYGQSYFRGDTHPNWLGGFYIYRFIIDDLNARRINGTRPLCLADLAPSIAAYEGDLRSQMNKAHLAETRDIWGDYLPAGMFDHCISYSLPESRRRARRVETPHRYYELVHDREPIVYENDDKSLPTAVVFRDSTSDFVIDLLAQHFSRCVFIWKEGRVIKEVIDAERPIVVLHIMAERFVAAYPQTAVALSQ